MNFLSLIVLMVMSLLDTQQQQQHSCVVHLDSVGGQTVITGEGGAQNYYSSGGVWARCVNSPTTMYSDSLAYYQVTNTVIFTGRVKFRDSSGTLDADKVTYWTRLERMYAEGNVYTRNISTGTELRGPNLDFFRAAPPVRDTQELTATGRPTIRFKSSNMAANADSINPFIIIADRVHLRHTDRFWGSGHVDINRPDMHATSDSAALTLGDSVGFLIGSPVVQGIDTAKMRNVVPRFLTRYDTTHIRNRLHVDTVRTLDSASLRPDSAVNYRLSGQRIRFDLTGKQQIKRVFSWGNADARGPQWHLTSDTLIMRVDSGAIQAAQAWGTERRATAFSGLNTIVADSLDIQMPKQVMRQVWAYGRSRATSKADSTWVEDDWLSGDSLLAVFRAQMRRDSLAADTAKPRSELDHVIAYGTARAYYHTDNQHDPKGERGVNYSRGDKINIAMNTQGKVGTVDIVGHVDGVYLEPKAPGDTIPDSLKTDSAGQAVRRSDGQEQGPGTPAPAPAPTPRRVPATPILPGRP